MLEPTKASKIMAPKTNMASDSNTFAPHEARDPNRVQAGRAGARADGFYELH